MSRAAKGADCKSAGLAFAGSSPASPTTLKSQRNIEEGRRPSGPFHVAHVAYFLKHFQRPPTVPGNSVRHTRNMTRSHVDCVRLLILGLALMPTLPLHRLSASTAPTAIALIEAVMLAPNDVEGRDELYRYSKREVGLR